MITIPINTTTMEGYQTFLKCKKLPFYKVDGKNVITDQESYNLVFKVEQKNDLRVESNLLFDYQRHIANVALDRKRYAAFLDCGLGKGQPHGSKVLTPDGWVNIEDLQIGQKIISSNGKAYNVKGVYPKQELPTYRFHFSDGVSFVCDIDHLHIVRTNNDRQRGKDWRVMSTKDLLECGNLRYGNEGKSRNYDIPVVSPIEFSKKDLPIDPYLLGVLIGDGCIRTSVQFSSPDSQIINEVKRIVEPSGFSVNHKDRFDYSITYPLEKRRNPIKDSLVDIGLFGKLSYDKFIPSDYLFSSIDDRLALLQGLMDTDGYIQDTTQFSTSSEKLASDVMFLVRSLGGIPTLSTKIPKYTYKDEERIGAKHFTLTFSLKTFNPFRLKSKAVKWNDNPRDNGRWIDRIEFECNQKTVCISVDSPDSSYVTENLIVTHNTAISLFWAQEVAKKGKVLLLCPLSVIGEFLNDHKKFSIQTPITNLRKTNGIWSEGIGIWNYENIKDLDLRGVSGIALDESSVLKNGDGVTKKWLCSLSSLIEYKLACSATPAPNEQSEYASHAVFLGVSNTNKEFYSRFFRKDGNNWRLKDHAHKAFYQNLSTWACYIHNPTLLGFECGGYLEEQPEYIVKPLPGKIQLDQGLLFSATAGLKEASKIYRFRSNENTDRFRYCVEQAEQHRSIVWCNRNDEESTFKKSITNSALITGSTPIEQRIEYIDAFRSGEINTLISKPKILGWGVNLQQADAHVYSGYDFSFEAMYQAVRRSHRYGRKGRLKVFFPMIEAERPIYEVIRQKMVTFEQDVINLQNQFVE